SGRRSRRQTRNTQTVPESHSASSIPGRVEGFWATQGSQSAPQYCKATFQVNARELLRVPVADHLDLRVDPGAFGDANSLSLERPRDARRRSDVDEIARDDVAAHLTVDHRRSHGEVGIDLRGLADHQRAIGARLALERPVEPDRSRERDLSIETGPAVQ